MLKHYFPFITILLTLLLIIGWQSDITAQEEVNWMTWEEAMEKSKTEKKKIFVDIYTNWCGWCRRMESTTFKDPVIVKYLNKHFYAVKFDGEYKKTINYNSKEYKFVKSGNSGYHELAAWMMKGRMGYPTVVFLDENVSIIQPIPGYLPPERFEPIMTYFAANQYKKTPWEIYQKKYKGTKTKAIPTKEQ